MILSKKSKSVFLIGIILINFIFISSIATAYTETLGYSPAFNKVGGGWFFGGSSLKVDESVCYQGTDFIVNIAPLSCEPTVVRSDLLAEEDVNVFCRMTATQINPLVQINQINNIRLSSNTAKEVKGVVNYLPAQPALGYLNTNLESPFSGDNMDFLSSANLGYAVITLRKQPNESALTNCKKTIFGSEVCWINGSITAEFNYDIKNSFGIGDALFYVPVMDEKEWNNDYIRYSFWDGRGYLRAVDVKDEKATLSLYSDNTVMERILSGERKYKLQKYSPDVTLGIGEESSKIYLQGLSPCIGNLQLKLEGIEDPDTFAQIKINEDSFELRKGESFLDGRCLVVDLKKRGINQEVTIRCREDDKASNLFTLSIFPKVDLEINGEKNSYEVGDYLYKNTEENSFVYLGYVASLGDRELLDYITVQKNLYAILISSPEYRGSSLTTEEINLFSDYVEMYVSREGETDTFSKLLKSYVVLGGQITLFGKYLMTGEETKIIASKVAGVEDSLFKGKKVFLEGLSGLDSEQDQYNLYEGGMYLDYYREAMDSFDTVVNSYPEQVPDENSLQDYGELALIEKINLAYKLGQREVMLKLCRQFAEDYRHSIYSPEICTMPLMISNSRNSVMEVVINGRIREISFERVGMPSTDDYSAQVVVRDSSGQLKTFSLRKERAVPLKELSEGDIGSGDREYIMLEKLDKDSAVIKIGVISNEGKFSTYSETLKKGGPSRTYGEYSITLTEVKLKKVAKVSIIANTDRAKSNSTFNFAIGVEKRAIQLSPEKAKERIEKVNKSIEDWSKVSKVLGGVVSAGKAACTLTEGYLVIKNFLQNMNGKSIARKEVMTGEGGWNKICEEEMKIDPKRFKSLNSCFLSHSEEIERDVNRLSNAVNEQNKILKGIETDDSERFISSFSKSVGKSIDSLKDNQIKGVEGLDKLTEALNSNSLIEKGAYSLEELKEIQMYVMYLNSTPANPNDAFRETAIKRLNSVIADVNKNSEETLDMLRKTKESNIDPSHVVSIGREKIENRDFIYQGDIFERTRIPVDGIRGDNPVAFGQYNGEVYLLVLEDLGGKTNHYTVKKIPGGSGEEDKHHIYSLDGTIVSNSEVINELKDCLFYKVDSGSLKNPYKSSYGSSKILLRYSGTHLNKNIPAVVPFDKKEGWYAGISSPTTSYDTSARLREFWLCNVGVNGIEEFQLDDFGDDYCILIEMGKSNEGNPFSGVPNIKSLVEQAALAINTAQRKYKDGIKEVYINANVENVEVGEPFVERQAGECTDTMSVEDCILLFNACDPVVCPSSRCDFGGNYKVQDVIQTGIVGGAFMCYPNAKWKGGDVYVPFCLSGINAGVENLITVQQAYANCLQKGITDGETVGICDEVHSIYLCEFFWKQAIPLIKLNGPKILEKIVGKVSKGGGEYNTFGDALNNAQNSINYFTRSYAEGSMRAFKIRSTEEIGTSICGSFASIVYPSPGGILSNIFTPDSPFQFTGKFEETVLTTVTNPPTSHYKVYFHIYAGTDSGAYYRVYLRGSGSSYYQDTFADRIVDSGYIEKGGFADEAIDFTAPSGYNTLCISVNGRERCGFKEVSTSFAVNYLSDLYLKDQAEKSGIKTKDECVSGSPSVYSLLDLNMQSAAENLLNSELYSQGIIRTCSMDSPGQATDPYVGTENERWKKVGYCDNQRVGCWIDTQSVKDAINFLNIEDKAISSIEKEALDYLSKTYYTIEEFNEIKSKIQSENDMLKRIKLINDVLNSGRVYHGYQKAYLYFERGKAYARLALEAFAEIILPDLSGTEYILGTSSEYNVLFKYDNKVSKMWYHCLEFLGAHSQELDCSNSANWIKVSEIKDDYSNIVGGDLNKMEGMGYEDGVKYLIDYTMSHNRWLGVKGRYASAYMLSKGNFILTSKDGNSINSTYDSGKGWKWEAYYSKIREIGRLDSWTPVSILTSQSHLCNYCNTNNCNSDLLRLVNEECALSKSQSKDFNGILGGLNYKDFYSGAIFIFESLNSPGSSTLDVDANFNNLYESPKFLFNDKNLLTSGDNCYRYFNLEWEWAVGCEQRSIWRKVSTFDEDVANGNANNQIQRTRDIIHSLQNHKGDYIRGLKVLIDEARAGKKAELAEKTYNLVSMNEEGIFTVQFKDTRYEYMKKLYYQYEGGKWNWMMDSKFVGGGVWQSISNVAPGFNDIQKDLSLRLMDRDFYEGAAIIFDYDSDYIKSLYPARTTYETGREVSRLASLMRTLSDQGRSSNLPCLCGSSCEAYAKQILASSKQYGIQDGLLLLAIMIQESSCVSSAVSSDGGDIGIMQINSNVHCGHATYNLFGGSAVTLESDKNMCKQMLLDWQINIDTGANILRQNYISTGKTYDCGGVVKTYTQWEAALRGYNGWGNKETGKCGSLNYVEEVKNKYFELIKLYEGDASISPYGIFESGPSEDILPQPQPGEDVSGASRVAVLSAMASLEGTSKAVVSDSDGNGINCWDSVIYVYDKANTNPKCVYSDRAGKTYTYNGRTITTSSNGPYQINEGACENVGLSQNGKLNLLNSGDILSVVYNEDQPHNVIFVEWVDKYRGIAKVFDWGAFSRRGVFEYSEVNLLDNQHSVYMVWKPISRT